MTGNLSALEIVRLKMGAYVSAVREESPAFTESEIEDIVRRNLRSNPEKVRFYSKWMSLGAEFQVEATLCLSFCLEAQATINRIQIYLNLGELAFLHKDDELFQPLAMTEEAAKKYRIDSVEVQKKRRLDGWYSIQDIFTERAFALLPEAERKKIKANEYDSSLWWSYLEAFPEKAWKIGEAALEHIKALIQSERLVFEVSGPTKDMLEMWPEIKGDEAVNVKAGWLCLNTLMGEKTGEALETLHGEYVISGCQGHQLYALKDDLPEWQEIIAKYVQAESLSDLPYCRPVAIIQEPYNGGHLDENGHFIPSVTDVAIKASAFHRALDKAGPNLFDQLNERARRAAQSFVLKASQLEVISEAVGIDIFSPFIASLRADLEEAVRTFNVSMAHLYFACSTTAEGYAHREYIERSKPADIVLDDLRPTQDDIDMLHRRLDDPSLDNWFTETFKQLMVAAG